MRLSGIILLVLISCNNLFAQENQGEQKENDLFRFGFAVGRFLPNRIAGISEIIPTAAARLAYSRKTYYLEASVIGGNAHSVNFYTLLFDARAFIDSISPGFFWIFGLHNMYYKRTNVTYEEVVINDSTHQSWAGWHYGIGYVSNSNRLTPRIDFVLAQKPGIALYMTLGFEF